MKSSPQCRAAIYARVSTFDQEPENQLAELRRYVEARGWSADEYVDKGVSGAKDSRPALDQLVKDAKRRGFDVLVVWRLDRLGRNLILGAIWYLGAWFYKRGRGVDANLVSKAIPPDSGFIGPVLLGLLLSGLPPHRRVAPGLPQGPAPRCSGVRQP